MVAVKNSWWLLVWWHQPLNFLKHRCITSSALKNEGLAQHICQSCSTARNPAVASWLGISCGEEPFNLDHKEQLGLKRSFFSFLVFSPLFSLFFFLPGLLPHLLLLFPLSSKFSTYLPQLIVSLRYVLCQTLIFECRWCNTSVLQKIEGLVSPD